MSANVSLSHHLKKQDVECSDSASDQSSTTYNYTFFRGENDFWKNNGAQSKIKDYFWLLKALKYF